jgi:hypothetical protein
VVLRLERDETDESDHARHGDHQQGNVDVERDVASRSSLPRVDTVRNGLTDRLGRSKETASARSRLDVGGERAEDPVDTELAPVSSAAVSATMFGRLVAVEARRLT